MHETIDVILNNYHSATEKTSIFISFFEIFLY